MNKAINNLERLVGSVTRLDTMTILAEGPSTAKDIQAELGRSRSTIWRVLTTLNELGWVIQSETGYELTPLGRAVHRGVTSSLETIEAATRLDDADLLTWLPVDDFPFELERFVDVTIAAPTRSDPQAPLRLATNHVEQATRIDILTHAASPDVLDAIARRTDEDDLQVVVVMTRDAYAALEREPKTASKLRTLRQATTVSLYRYEDEIPHILSILDGDRLGYGVGDDQGRPRGVLEIEDDVVVNWATDVFESYRQDAVLLDAP